MKDGFGTQRFDLMYNDFVIVGPPEDPAGIKGKICNRSAEKNFRKTSLVYQSGR